MSEIFQIKGRVIGDRKLRVALATAPGKYRTGLFSWLMGERKKFVGDKGADGVFRKKLRRKISKRGKPWELRIIRNFKGYISGENQIDSMRLTMGLPDSKKKIFEGLRMLGTGGTITSSKFMIVPIWENLRKIGITGAAHRHFKEMMSHRFGRGPGRGGLKQLLYVREGGRMYFFDADQPGVGDGLLYIGVKRVVVKRQFNFEGDWDRRIPKVLIRGQKRVDRTTKQIEKGSYV